MLPSSTTASEVVKPRKRKATEVVGAAALDAPEGTAVTTVTTIPAGNLLVPPNVFSNPIGGETFVGLGNRTETLPTIPRSLVTANVMGSGPGHRPHLQVQRFTCKKE